MVVAPHSKDATWPLPAGFFLAARAKENFCENYIRENTFFIPTAPLTQPGPSRDLQQISTASRVFHNSPDNDNPATGAPYKRKNRYLWRNGIG